MATPKSQQQQQVSPTSKAAQLPSATTVAEEIIKKYALQGYNTAFTENDIIAKDSIFEKDVIFKVRIESQNSKKKVDINLNFDLQSSIAKDYLLSDTKLSSKGFEILKTEKLPKFEKRIYYTFGQQQPSDVFINFVGEFIFKYNQDNKTKVFTDFENERFSFGGIPEKDINKFLKLFIEEANKVADDAIKGASSTPAESASQNDNALIPSFTIGLAPAVLLLINEEFVNVSKKLTIKNKLIN